MRQRKPYWKSSHKCYYFKHHGKEVRLHPDLDEATRLWHKIAGGGELQADPKVSELIAAYLDWAEENLETSTYEWYRDHLQSFHESIGAMRLSTLKPLHVTKWLSARYGKKVSDNTKAGAITAVKRVFNWSKREGYISESPVQYVSKPTTTSRKIYFTPEQATALFKAIQSPEFLLVATTMRHTGCRPQELRRVEARHVVGDRWVFPPKESKGKRESRIVLLNSVAQEITDRLVKERPTGPLFLNKNGRPWTKDSLNCHCQRLTRKLGFRVNCYAIRHTFATDAIIAGVDLITIKELMGHSDLKMLTQIYQHVKQRDDHMRESLRKATGA